MLQLVTVPFPHSLCAFDALSQQDLDQPAAAKRAREPTGNSPNAFIRSSRDPAARLPTCTHFTNVNPHLVQLQRPALTQVATSGTSAY